MAFVLASDGVRLHVRDAGRGRPIVFVHGWTMSGDFFHRQLEGLKAEYRCLAPDLRGCGDSETRRGTHRMARLSEDLRDIMDYLNLDGAILVGWSLGGGVVMDFLERFGPRRVGGVVLVDFTPRFEEDASIADKVCDRLRTDRARFMDSFFRRMFLSPLPPDELARLRAENEKCASGTGCELYRQLGSGSSIGRRYEVPALLVFPQQGWFPAAAAQWREIFPRNRSAEFAASRHCPFLEEPDRFNDALRSFAREEASAHP